ncbi:hypothetical protein JXL21_13940 [Candidatus Bathyarchaeota archaeon]|nr:hypothetical protein [Candidatus Bathyarchaeota archaeon]
MSSTGTRRTAAVLAVSLLINVLLAGGVGYLVRDRGNMQSQVNDLTISVQTLQNELNITRTELTYSQSQAEYYARLVERSIASEGFVGEATVNIVAVRSIRNGFSVVHEGVTMVADIEAKVGEGRILVDTEPRIGIDIQTSVRTAIDVAERVTGISLGMTDVILTISAEEENEIVDGSSAGGCITVALIAALNGDEPDPTVYMTGTIESDGSIGSVGAVAEKALAAAEREAAVFLVPEGQSTVIVQIRKESHPFPGMTVVTYEPRAVALQDYLAEQGYTVEVNEVGDVEEAYRYFVGPR